MSKHKKKPGDYRPPPLSYFDRRRRLIMKRYPKRVLDIDETWVCYKGIMIQTGYRVTLKKPYSNYGEKQTETWTMDDVELFVQGAQRISEEEWDSLPDSEEDDGEEYDELLYW